MYDGYLRESYDHELAMQEEFKRQGLEEGRELGITEGQASIVKNMLDNGISKEQISKMTKISLTDIEKYINIKYE